MEDLLAKMQALLSSKEGQEQIKSMAEMMGVADNLPDMSNMGNISDMFNNNSNNNNTDSEVRNQPNQTNQTNQNNNENKNPIQDLLAGIDINMLLKVQQVLGSMNNTDDKDTKLLLALKPHFKQERQDKIDKAVKVLQLLTILPLIKDSGLLGGFFGNGDKQ